MTLLKFSIKQPLLRDPSYPAATELESSPILYETHDFTLIPELEL